MCSVNRLIVCVRSVAATRLNVADVVLKNTKCLWGSLLADTRAAKSLASWPLVARALSSQCSYDWQPRQVRAYRTARPENTATAAGYSQNVYDENEVGTEGLYVHRVCRKTFPRSPPES